MGRGRIALVAAALVAAAAPAAAQAAPRGLPEGAALPNALVAPEPILPAPAGWAFGEDFPRTSGTGRYADGAWFWSDFLYDDAGAAGSPHTTLTGFAGGFPIGTYRYADAAAHRNGADIFRAAVGLDGDATVWRVDWNTLADPNVPIAAWALDTDADAATGRSEWPGNAGVVSPGIEKALLVSARAARLVDLRTGVSTPLEASVDRDARSFVVRVPLSLLPASGTWTVRLAAGVANASGTGFAPVGLAEGALPGQPNVYNATFRDYDDEPSPARLADVNPWFERAQAVALADGGDVSDFATTVHWGRLAAHQNEPEPVLKGRWTNRWYVSSVEPYEGVRTEPFPGTSLPAGNLLYGNRVQPYGAFVPTSYGAGSEPAGSFWVLHGGGENHNLPPAAQEGLMNGACEQRHSICVAPLSRGPTHPFTGIAELDFWEVWRGLAADFRLDPDRAVVGGYSMGVLGAFRFAQNYPDLFASVYLIMQTDFQMEPQPGLYFDLLENLRWTPLYHMDSVIDEPEPPPLRTLEMQAMDRLGYRYVYDTYLLEEHVSAVIKDDYGDLIEYLKSVGPRERDPGHITYRWYPATVHEDLGIGPSGAWWTRELRARDRDAVARVDAVSHAQPDPAVTPERSRTFRPDARPSPALRETLTWRLGATPAREPRIALDLENVAAITVDLAGAGLGAGDVGTVEVDTNGTVAITLRGPAGERTETVPAGHHTLVTTGLLP